MSYSATRSKLKRADNRVHVGHMLVLQHFVHAAHRSTRHVYDLCITRSHIPAKFEAAVKMFGSLCDSMFILLLLQQIVFSNSLEVGKCSKPYTKCSGKKWQHDAVCSFQEKCTVVNERVFSFMIEARLKPLNTGSSIGSLWMRGNGPGMSWDKPIEMKRSGSSLDSWKTKLSYRSSSDALLCASGDYCFANQKAVEFRLYKDQMGKDDMLGPNFYIELPLSESMEGDASFLTPSYIVYPWFDGDIVVTRQYEVESSLNTMGIQGGLATTLDVLYPPSFEHNIRKKYPLVFYVGYFTKMFPPLLEHAFVHESHIQEAIFVGMRPLDHAPFARQSPYPNSYVWHCTSHHCSKQIEECATCWLPRVNNVCDKKEFAFQAERCLVAKIEQSYGDAILNFIENDILPKIKEVTQNRVLVDFPKHRMSIVGDQDGPSLLACYAALTKPHIYQNAACLSAPFYWPITSSVKDPAPNPGIHHTFQEIRDRIAETPALSAAYLTQKYYIDIAYNQHAVFPLVDVYKHTEDFVKQLEETLYLEKGKNILFFTVPDVAITYALFWDYTTLSVYQRILPALKFFLRAEGGPSKDGARTRPVLDKVIAEQNELYGGLIRNSNNTSPTVADQFSCDADYTPPSQGLSRPTEVPIIFFLPILGVHTSL